MSDVVVKISNALQRFRGQTVTAGLLDSIKAAVDAAVECDSVILEGDTPGSLLVRVPGGVYRVNIRGPRG